MKLDPIALKKLLRAAARARPEEIGCAACFEALDRFAEMVRAGRPAAEVMPLVEEHLERCADCREEYEALLDALQAVEG